MKRSTFDNIIGFLQGIFWAFLLIGAWIIFHIVSIFGLPLALFFTFLFIFFALMALLLLESMRINRLKADETAMREGLPVTTVARTIGDVAHGGLAHEQVIQAIQDALGRGLTTAEELLAQAERRGGRVEQIIRSVLEGDSET